MVLPDNLRAFSYTPGKVDFTPLGDAKIYYWSRVTPLACIHVPLSAFAGIDLKQITSVTLLMGSFGGGSFYLDSVYLQ